MCPADFDCDNVHVFPPQNCSDENIISFLPIDYRCLGIDTAEETKTTQDPIDFDVNQTCERHPGQIVHSHTINPYSTLCDQCIAGLDGLDLEIRRLPNFESETQKILQEIKASLKRKKRLLETLQRQRKKQKAKQSAVNLRGKIESHFNMISRIVAAHKPLVLQNVLEQRKEPFLRPLAEFKGNTAELEAQLDTAEFQLRRSDMFGECIESLQTLLRKAQSWVSTIKQVSVQVRLHADAYSHAKHVIESSCRAERIVQQPDHWFCDTCGASNSDGYVICSQCSSFRPLKSYPFLLQDPDQVTNKELEELNKRRQLEKHLFVNLDSRFADEGVLFKARARWAKNWTGEWFLISVSWILKWLAFLNSESIMGDETSSTNSDRIGVLPPGPISNSGDLINAEGVPYQHLIASEHYTAVSDKVWMKFIQIYGGGPAVVREAYDIYSEIVRSPESLFDS